MNKDLNKYTLVDGTKSISLNQLPKEAWTSVTGGEETVGGRSQLATKSFRLLSVANRSVSLRANALASLPWTVSNMNGDNIYSTDDAALPKELQFLKGFKRSLYLTEATMSIFARSYLFLTPPYKKKDSVRWVMATTVDPIWDNEFGLTGFRRMLSKEDQRDFSPDRFCFFTIPNPLHETMWGVSPLSAGADAANVMINLNAFANQFIERGAIKATLLRVDPSMPQKDRTALKSWWSGMLSGIRNAWQTNVLSTAVEPVIVGEGLKDISDMEISRARAEEVAIAMGVPFSVLFSNAANHATAITDQRNFYTYTILPEAGFIAEELNEKLFNPLGYIFSFEEEMIKVFQNSEKERAETYKAYVDSGMRPSIAAQVSGLTLPPQLEFKKLDEKYDMGMEAAQRALEEPEEETTNGEENTNGAASASSTEQENDQEQDDEETNATKEEAGTFRRWAKKRIKDGGTKEWYIEDFTATYLDSGQKRAIVAELLRESMDEDEMNEDDEVSFHPALKETREEGDPDANKLEERATRDIRRGLREQESAVFAGNEDRLDGDPENVNMGELLGAPSRITASHETASDALRRAILDGAVLGTETAITGLEGFGIGFNYLLVNEAAREWANQYAGELITRIDRTTQRSVQRAIAQWVENGEPLRQLKRELAPTFGERRAKTIAATEVTRSYAEGNRIAFAESGVVEKIEWRAAADERVCPICGVLHGKQAPLDTGFKDYGFPPAHVNCRCWIVPVINVPQLEQPTVEQPVQQSFQRYLPSDEVKKKAEETVNRNVEMVAKRFNTSPAKVYLEAKKGMQHAVDNNEVAIQIHGKSIGRLIESGRFKSQFETNKSSATLDKESRAEGEFLGIGIPRDIEDSKRPIYGFINIGNGPTNFSVETYGEVTAVLKDSVRERTTVTAGDSLASFVANTVHASPIEKIEKGSIDSRTAALYQYNKDKDNNFLRRGFDYLEVQIQGGVSLEDVAGFRDPSGKISKSNRKKLENMGIQIWD